MPLWNIFITGITKLNNYTLITYYGLFPLDAAISVTSASALAKTDRIVKGGEVISTATLKSVAEYRQQALEVAQSAANNIMQLKKTGEWSGKIPAVCAGVVHMRTGKVIYYNHSNVLNLSVHPILKAAEPVKSLEGSRAVANCAEYNIINQALHSGISRADLKDLIIMSVYTKNSKRILAPCKNCEYIMKQLGIPVFQR